VKVFSILIVSWLFAICVHAQAPQKFSYQTVIRNAGNQLVANQQVGIKISILQGSANGSAVYAETHNPQTNTNGLATLEIGGGSLLSGNFANINWANGPFFVKTETDPNGGNNYTITNTSQLLSVPYAMYASSANTSNNGVPVGGTNGQFLTNCNGVATWTTAGQCPGTIASFDCASANNTGTLTALQSASGVSSDISYTGGGGGTHIGQTVTSTGVTGLTATLAAGTFASGAGNLIYSITGTPSTSGIASFALNIGGQTCTLTRSVNLPVGIISALSCTNSINTGLLIQGGVAANVTSSVPYTGGNGGTYTGQTVTSTGVSGLTATLAAGTFASGAGSLTYTITGTPSSSGTASFTIGLGGQTCTLTRTVSLPAGTITALNCASATNSGSLTSGIASSNVSSSVPYTGGNGGTHIGQTVTSTGVTGLTATLTAGTFASGAGSLTYTITGTPVSSGTVSFALNIGGQTCTLTRNVNLPVGTITALNCASATSSGILTSGSASSNVSSSVTYTGGNGGTHNGQTATSTGVTGLTATLAAGTFASGAGSLTYTITGTPASSGTASFVLSVGGQTCTLTRTVLPVGTLITLNCASANNSGTLTSFSSASGVSSSVPYIGGNGGTYSAQTINSTGVTGLTATLAAGTLLSGAGSLIYTITGTPATSGAASFALNVGGQTCTLTRMVDLPVGTITALSCSTATNTGTLIQGLAAASVSSSVPYTGGNGGIYTEQNIASTGVTGLTATLAAGNLLIGAGSLTYTITGTPAASGTASFSINIGGQACTLNIEINTGTPATCGATNVHNPAKTYGSMTDQQGNIYKTIVIGSQEWMAENLKTSIYRNGNPISTNLTDAEWQNTLTTQISAWSFYNNDNQNECPYGKLYNWYAVTDSRNLCPTGWHVPSEAEWIILTDYYGGGPVSGGKMKSTGFQYWESPNSGANNISGFSSLPGGLRNSVGSFTNIRTLGSWWSSSEYNLYSARYLGLSAYGDGAGTGNSEKRAGYSVRCLKD
jgi:uncharacterized protein (TIGR02145 family)